MTRRPPVQAAKDFLKNYFPDCQGALLAGSVVRGEETSTSDLDIVIIDNTLSSAYRESFFVHDWPIEAFFHNEHTIRQYFQTDCERGRPSLPRMVAEGIIIRAHPLIPILKEEAGKLLGDGPSRWSKETVEMKRYFLTDALDDFVGSADRGEGLFIANLLAEMLHEFVLRTNRRWTGQGKWVLRALKEYDPEFAERFLIAFDQFYSKDDKRAIVQLVESVLEQHGGRLFDGFSRGKQ